MKDLVNKIIGQAHILILIYGIYGVYVAYDEHSLKITEIESQFPSVNAEITANLEKVKEIQEFVKKTEESKIRVEEVAKNIEAAQKQLPADIDDNQILKFFNLEIGALNIKDPNITPGKEAASTYFISKEYQIKAKGTFLQFLIYFERVGSAARIYNVKSFKLLNDNPGQKGRFQLISAEGVIEAFRFNPDFKVDRGFDKLETP